MSNVAVLAVSSYEKRMDKLDAFSKKLCLMFDDVTNPNDPSALNKKIAETIASYIKGLPAQFDTLLICCDSGESRSTALSASIMRYNGMDEMKIWKNPHYHPNTQVYLVLCGS